MNPDKSSRQKKMLVAVLALGLGGLAVDRLILGGATGPQEAAAHEDVSPATAATDAIIAANASSKSPEINRSKTVAGRLDRMAAAQGFNLTEVEDAFRPSTSWVRAAQKPAAEKIAPKATDSETFVKNHKLMAVVNNSSGGAAIIGNRTVVIGKEIDGFTLVLVTPRGAILEKDGQRVELTLPKPKQNSAQE